MVRMVVVNLPYYWALYTLLECSIKKDDKEVLEKYFKKTGEVVWSIFILTGRSDSFY